MMNAVCILLLSFGFQTADVPPADPQRKELDRMLLQVRRLAASEPLAYGLLTRLEAAEILTAKQPRLAREFIEEARSAVSGVTQPSARNLLLVIVAERFAPLDLEEAERIASAIPATTGPGELAEAYDGVAGVAKKDGPERFQAVVSNGLSAGAFRMSTVSELLNGYATGSSPSPDGASALFAQILAAFPATHPQTQDVFLLLDRARVIAGVSRPLAIEAVEKALRAATSDDLTSASPNPVKADITLHGQRVRTQNDRETILLRTAALIRAIDPKLLESYAEQLQDWGGPVQAASNDEVQGLLDNKLDTAAPPAEVRPEPPDVTVLPYVDALSAARQIENWGARVGALIEISRREDLTPKQRGLAAAEALSATAQMRVGNDRLMGQAMLSRDFARLNEPSNAALAAQMLSDTYGKACECGALICQVSGEEFNCVELVDLFAQYLAEMDISQESLGLQNVSLEVRLLLQKVDAAVNGKDKRKFIF